MFKHVPLYKSTKTILGYIIFQDHSKIQLSYYFFSYYLLG